MTQSEAMTKYFKEVWSDLQQSHAGDPVSKVERDRARCRLRFERNRRSGDLASKVERDRARCRLRFDRDRRKETVK